MHTCRKVIGRWLSPSLISIGDVCDPRSDAGHEGIGCEKSTVARLARSTFLLRSLTWASAQLQKYAAKPDSGSRCLKLVGACRYELWFFVIKEYAANHANAGTRFPKLGVFGRPMS